MELQLKRLRKKAGFKRQKDMAEALNIPERRYASWEREEVMMSLEQAYEVTEVLGCTLDELVGRKPSIAYPDKDTAITASRYAALPFMNRVAVKDMIDVQERKMEKSEPLQGDSREGVA